MGAPVRVMRAGPLRLPLQAALPRPPVSACAWSSHQAASKRRLQPTVNTGSPITLALMALAMRVACVCWLVLELRRHMRIDAMQADRAECGLSVLFIDHVRCM